jgi:hypothetical protein
MMDDKIKKKKIKEIIERQLQKNVVDYDCIIQELVKLKEMIKPR